MRPLGESVLRFTFVGYEGLEEAVNNRQQIDVSLIEDEAALDEVVVVGYGTQKKVTLTGAVSGVKGTEMRETKNENPQNMLAGRIAGVRVWQKSAEPGSYNANFDIRGMGGPLVIIDGVPRSTEDFQRLNPNDIEDISVLKDASASIYGVRSANGVMLVTTRKGREGSVSVGYNGSFTFQQPSNMPYLASAIDAMTLYNEQSMNNINGGSLIYTEKDFEAFRNGTRRSSDWTPLIFADVSPQTSHDMSVSGGLPVYSSRSIAPGEQGYFLNVDLIENKQEPQVLAGASRIDDEQVSGSSYRYVAKSPIETTNISRVLLPKQPTSVRVDGVEAYTGENWDAGSKTYLLGFENNPEGVSVEFVW